MAIFNTGLTRAQISEAFDRALNYDSMPTKDSIKFVTSGGVYDFVNSSVATNTAYFIGTFNSVEDLEAYSGTLTNNDYAFVVGTDSAGNTKYDRYKYSSATTAWIFEYTLNNSSFTSTEWATIQSGMTSADKTKLDTVQTGANKTEFDTVPTQDSGKAVTSGGLFTLFAPKTQDQYDALVSKTEPIYFIYET